jgi:hypothetical protein
MANLRAVVCLIIAAGCIAFIWQNWSHTAPIHLTGEPLTPTSAHAAAEGKEIAKSQRIAVDAGSIRPAADTAIEVVVVDSSNSPVPECKLILVTDNDGLRRIDGYECCAKTNEEGVARVRRSNVASESHLVATRHGYCPQLVSDLGASDRQRVVLAPMASIEMRVTDESGAPIQGMQVAFGQWDPGSPRAESGQVDLITIVDGVLFTRRHLHDRCSRTFAA